MRVPCVLIALVMLTAAPPAAAQSRPAHGKLFPPQDLGLLEGPDRDLWQLPGQIMDALGVAEGSVVADIGAGGGWFTIRLARRVGPNGIVYSEDIQKQMLEATGRRVSKEGLRNVQTVLGTADDPQLPGTVDSALIVDTYHELENPVVFLRNTARALKPQGRIGVVDFKRDGFGPGSDTLEDRVDPDQIVRDAEAAGLKLVRRETFLPYQFLLIFSRQ